MWRRAAILMAAVGLALPALAAMTTAELDRLQASANSGNGDAAFRLGRAYKTGEDVQADLDKAEHWFERAAQLGNARAVAELGLVLAQNGKGRAAQPFLKQAAEKGDARAQYALGALLFGGQGVAVDAAQGRDWMRRAARAGLPAAVEALAVMDKALAPAAKAIPVQIVSIARPAALTPAVAKPIVVKQRQTVPPDALVWRAQLGMFAKAENARRYWRQVDPGIVKPLAVAFPSRGALTRVLVGPFATKAEARRFCDAQRRHNRDCLEVKGGG